MKHVIWDWNGTLLDDADLCVEVMNAVLGKRGLPELTLQKYADFFRFPVRDYYRDLGFDFDRESFEVVGTEFIEGYSAIESRSGLREHALDVLHGVTKLGLTQSVLSASQRTRLEQQVKRLNLDAHFTALVGLEDHYAHGKVELGRAWMRKSGIDPKATVLVGDTDHDLEVAKALGVECVLIPSGHQSEERLAKLGATVVKNLRGVLEVLATR